MKKKGISLISAVIFIGLTISVIALVYQAGMPIVDKMQASAAIERTKNNFVKLDDIIQRVASEANGSRRTLSFKIDPGELVVDDANDIIYWIFETSAPVFSPRTASYYGNLAFGSNLETKAYEGDYSGIQSYILENKHLKVYIRKIGSSDNMQNYETSNILLGVYQKDLGKWMDAALEISIDDDISSISGTGYTKLEKPGSALPYGKVTAYMYSSPINYFINFTLESGADFIKIEGGRL